MHMKHSDEDHGPKIIPVKFILDDPKDLTDTNQTEWETKGATGESILEVALDAGIKLEHSCGGVCACSTCHVYVEKGIELVSEPEEDEEDRVEEAPGLQINSRLSCQCTITSESDSRPIVIRVPAWNRNAVKEVPH